MRIEYTEKERELAVKFGLQPFQIRAISETYDFITRFATIKNKEELEQVVMESPVIIDGKRGYKYKELPTTLSKTIEKFFKKVDGSGRHGNLNLFYSWHKKEKNLDIFVQTLVKERVSPHLFWVDGLITYRNLKREPTIDETVTFEAHEYQG